MNIPSELICLSPEVETALADNTPVVALETTFLAHGLPSPHDMQTATAIEDVIRAQGAIPAFIGIDKGRIQVGLNAQALRDMSASGASRKASRRDLAALITLGESGATTVAATMVCAAKAGIAVFATGGIGGVHRGYDSTLDVSADLIELGRTPVAVVCSGIKSILDIPRTLEFLETHGVVVIGYGVDKLPAFYLRDCGLDVDYRLQTPSQAAQLIITNRHLGSTGVLITNPIPVQAEVEPNSFDRWLQIAERDASKAGIKGKEITPFLLGKIFELSAGVGLNANKALLVDNARVGAQIACALTDSQSN